MYPVCKTCACNPDTGRVKECRERDGTYMDVSMLGKSVRILHGKLMLNEPAPVNILLHLVSDMKLISLILFTTLINTYLNLPVLVYQYKRLLF